MNSDAVLKQMHQLSKSAPEGDFTLWVEACQELADVAAALHGQISEEQFGVLVGVGALMARQGFREMQAGNHTHKFFRGD